MINIKTLSSIFFLLFFTTLSFGQYFDGNEYISNMQAQVLYGDVQSKVIISFDYDPPLFRTGKSGKEARPDQNIKIKIESTVIFATYVTGATTISKEIFIDPSIIAGKEYVLISCGSRNSAAESYTFDGCVVVVTPCDQPDCED